MMADSNRRRWWLIGGAGVVAVVAALFVWGQLSPRESTDDAQVSGHVSPLAARVGGTVKAVHVNDNQSVNAGDVLIEIDPHDYQIALSRAEADLAAAQAGSRGARVNVPIASTTTKSELNVAQIHVGNTEAAVRVAMREVEANRAKLAAAQARLAESQAAAMRASQDLARLRPLAAKDEISKQQLDAAFGADQGAKAAVAGAEASIAEAQANLEAADARRLQAEGTQRQAEAESRAAGTGPQQVAMTEARAQTADAQVLQAQAALEQARLNLERTTVRAPVAGIVSRKTVEIGQVVQPGQALLAITSLADLWVTANFKETQLRRMQPGLHADIAVDAFGGSVSGHVDSIAAATGATFSLLPPENASGNFVKVVQRVPVKIALDAPQAAGQLRPGMSATVTVHLK